MILHVKQRLKIEKMEFKNYLKQNKKDLVNSFKQLEISKVVLIMLFDFLFYSLCYLIIFVFSKFIEYSSRELNSMPAVNIMQLPQRQGEILMSMLKVYFFKFVASIILTILIIYILMCVFKLLIWFKVTDRKVTKKEVIRFLWVRFVFVLISALFLILLIPLLISIGVSVKYQSLILLVIFSSIGLVLFAIANNIKTLMYIYYTKDKNLSCIKKAFSLGIKQIKQFIVPYIIVFIVFNLIILIISIMSKVYLINAYLPGIIAKILYFIIQLISIVLILYYAAWFRFYIYNVIKTIDKKV
jgi:hypothetical protein